MELCEDMAWSRHEISPAELLLVRRSECLEIPTRTAAPQPQKNKQAKGKTLNQFNVFRENNDDDDGVRPASAMRFPIAVL